MQPYKIDITAMGREGVNVIMVVTVRNDFKLDGWDTKHFR